MTYKMEDAMSYKNRISMLVTVFLLCAVLSGCVHNVPLAVDPNKDMDKAFPRTKKIPAKVGIYIGDDLKKYVYKQKKMGMTFQMNVGEYLPPIGLEMASVMFKDVVPVNSLPPYSGNYKPDVEAVVEPEILYCYGDAVGTLSGYIEGRAKIRITAYDLSGKVLWQDEAMGSSRSKEMSFVGAFVGGMEEVGKVGYEAAFAAAVKIIDDFNSKPPKELNSLLEIKRMDSIKNRRNISNFDLFKKYYEKGQFQYENKNYYQALYSFEKADGLNPGDPSTLFYIGVCYTYIGEKDRAMDKLRKVVEMNPGGQEAKDSKKWLEILSTPLKIAVIDFNNGRTNLTDAPLRMALTDSLIYELVDVEKLKPPKTQKSQKEWNQFLDKCVKNGIKIILVNDVSSLSQKINIEQQPGADVATEHVVKISSKAYSAKKKEVRADIIIAERATTIREQSKEAEDRIKAQLLKIGAEKLVLRLLENDIY